MRIKAQRLNFSTNKNIFSKGVVKPQAFKLEHWNQQANVCTVIEKMYQIILIFSEFSTCLGKIMILVSFCEILKIFLLSKK